MAEANRAAIIAAAKQHFLDVGYATSTLAAIAADAGVSVPTVYKGFTSKAGLLKSVFDVAVAGDLDPIPMAEREVIREIIDEPSAARKLEMYAKHLASRMPDAAPLQLIARDAAAADPDAADVWAVMGTERLTAMGMFAADLKRTGELTVPERTARDLLWMYTSPEAFEMLVLRRGWSTRRYGQFLTGALCAALVERPADVS
jgi:AcrR family transcriptional regulator